MTAEVAILNIRGIAMAADSASTLWNGKVYNSADKLFALSKYHPVGIMIHSSSGIMGINWETIIKCYRDQLGEKSFDSLFEYEEDFIKYLEEFSHLTKEKSVKYLEYECGELFKVILSYFIGDLQKDFDGKENITLKEIDKVFNENLKFVREVLESKDNESLIKPVDDFVDSNREAVNSVIEYVFEKYKLSKKQIEELIALAKLNFQKCHYIDNYTGIVIAGYGDKEILPALSYFKVSGKIGDSIICFKRDRDQISDNNTAWIAPFAQTEIVHQFVKGIDPDFYTYIIEKVEEMLKSISPFIKDINNEKADALNDIFKKYMDSIIEDVYKGPIVDIVASMEKSELVSMAEALVNITALKRHISDDDETVGGSIDVALITKSDGFIWIKNKTNYDPNINLGLYQNYFRRGKYGQKKEQI